MKNTGYARLAFLALLATALTACATGQKHGSAGTYVEDSTITTHVKAAIFQESGLNTGEIHVETYNGIVRLSGFVSQSSLISKAETVAKSVDGVREVKNRLATKH